MAAYVIVDIRVTEPERYDEYKKQVPATLKEYGGRFLVRGGDVQTLEGDWFPERLVVIEFDSVEQARRWWSSAQYAGPKLLRQRASTGHMIVVEGV